VDLAAGPAGVGVAPREEEALPRGRGGDDADGALHLHRHLARRPVYENRARRGVVLPRPHRALGGADDQDGARGGPQMQPRRVAPRVAHLQAEPARAVACERDLQRRAGARIGAEGEELAGLVRSDHEGPGGEH
jgi:hypothetical protein